MGCKAWASEVAVSVIGSGPHGGVSEVPLFPSLKISPPVGSCVTIAALGRWGVGPRVEANIVISAGSLLVYFQALPCASEHFHALSSASTHFDEHARCLKRFDEHAHRSKHFQTHPTTGPLVT